jgi:hypothetical protein
MEFNNLNGKDLDQWAEKQGIKRYIGFLFMDSDEKFKEEIRATLKNKTDSDSKYYIEFANQDYVSGAGEVIACKQNLVLVLLDKMKTKYDISGDAAYGNDIDSYLDKEQSSCFSFDGNDGFWEINIRNVTKCNDEILRIINNCALSSDSSKWMLI